MKLMLIDVDMALSELPLLIETPTSKNIFLLFYIKAVSYEGGTFTCDETKKLYVS